MRGVSRAKETLGAMKEFVVMLVPAHAFAGTKGIDEFRHCFCGRKSNLECAGQEGRALFVRQGKRLLFRQAELPCRGIKRDVSARSLRGKPLANVALGRTCTLSEFSRGLRPACGEAFVQAELVANNHAGGVEGGAKIVHTLMQNLIELFLIKRHGRNLREGYKLQTGAPF